MPSADLDLPDRLEVYRSRLEDLLIDNPDADIDADLLKLRVRLRISHARHGEIHHHIVHAVDSIGHLKDFTFEFNEHVGAMAVGSDVLMQFRFGNRSATERLRVAVDWQKSVSTDSPSFHCQSLGFIRPGQAEILGSTLLAQRGGVQEIGGMVLSVENTAGDRAEFMLEPLRFTVPIGNATIVNQITHNTRIEGRVIDASGVATTNYGHGSSPEPPSGSPRWRAVSYRIRLPPISFDTPLPSTPEPQEPHSDPETPAVSPPQASTPSPIPVIDQPTAQGRNTPEIQVIRTTEINQTPAERKGRSRPIGMALCVLAIAMVSGLLLRSNGEHSVAPDTGPTTPTIHSQRTTDAEPVISDKGVEDEKSPAIPPPSSVVEDHPAIDPSESIVRRFYDALGRGDGDTASSLVVPEKRRGPYESGNLSRFYGSLEEKLILTNLTRGDGGGYDVRYRFRLRVGGPECDGFATVYTTENQEPIFISKIVAHSKC